MEDEADRFIDTLIRYVISTVRPMKVSCFSVRQALMDEAYQLGLRPEREIYTGSLFEGFPVVVCRDRDVMVLHRGMPNVMSHEWTNDDQTQRYKYVLKSETVSRNPAYIRIQVESIDHVRSSEKTQVNKMEEGLGRCIIHMEEATMLSSMSYAEWSCGRCPGYEIHGPAATGLNVPEQPKYGMKDTVHCLKADGWPPCTQNYFKRSHLNTNWPSQTTKQKIADSDVFVVAVGPHNSESKDTEWRWSFSVAEKLLLYSMSDSEAGGVFLLKALKKSWKKENSESLVSYFIKTASFWVCEENNFEAEVNILVIAT